MATILSADKIDAQLWKLHDVCRENLYKNRFSNYVLFALNHYINTGRASVAFLKRFIALQNEDLLEMVDTCLKGKATDDDIIKVAKDFVKKKVPETSSGVFMK